MDKIKAVFEAIGAYGLQCAQTQELAPPRSLVDLIESLASHRPLAGGEAEPVAWRSRNVMGPEDYWTYSSSKSAAHIQYQEQPLYAAPPIAPAVSVDAIYEVYKTWPEDIRKKLSLHDLRRMNGWTPPTVAMTELPECNHTWREDGFGSFICTCTKCGAKG
jgi:hypothetical protein